MEAYVLCKKPFRKIFIDFFCKRFCKKEKRLYLCTDFNKNAVVAQW